MLPQKDRMHISRNWILGIATGGALGSIALTLQAGEQNKSYLLILMFCCWVTSPFVAVMVASRNLKNWNRSKRLFLIILTVLITAVSLVGYSAIFHRSGMKHAFIFLFIPFISWILLISVYFIWRIKKVGIKS
jgi:O-antigen/teichoic acid export membrane protein